MSTAVTETMIRILQHLQEIQERVGASDDDVGPRELTAQELDFLYHDSRARIPTVEGTRFVRIEDIVRLVRRDPAAGEGEADRSLRQSMIAAVRKVRDLAEMMAAGNPVPDGCGFSTDEYGTILSGHLIVAAAIAAGRPLTRRIIASEAG